MIADIVDALWLGFGAAVGATVSRQRSWRTYAPGALMLEVGRRQAISPQQLSAGRRRLVEAIGGHQAGGDEAIRFDCDPESEFVKRTGFCRARRPRPRHEFVQWETGQRLTSLVRTSVSSSS